MSTNVTKIFLISLTAVATSTACSPRISIGTLDTTSSSSTGAPSPTVPSVAACPVETIATGLKQPTALAYADQYLFVAVDFPNPNGAVMSSIDRIPLSGGSAVHLSESAQVLGPALTAMVADGANVYWAGIDGAVRTVAIDGGATTILYQGDAFYGPSDPDAATSVAISGQSVFIGSQHGAIRSVPLGGGPVTTMVQPAPGERMIALAADETNLYWLDGSNSVKKIPLGGGAPTELVHGSGIFYNFALSGGSLFVAALESNVTSTVHEVRTDQSLPPSVLASNELPARGIAADATGVYWVGGDYGPTPVRRMAPGGSASETIAAAGQSHAMVPCADGICWIEESNGSLMRYVECAP